MYLKMIRKPPQKVNRYAMVKKCNLLKTGYISRNATEFSYIYFHWSLSSHRQDKDKNLETIRSFIIKDNFSKKLQVFSFFIFFLQSSLKFKNAISIFLDHPVNCILTDFYLYHRIRVWFHGQWQLQYPHNWEIWESAGCRKVAGEFPQERLENEKKNRFTVQWGIPKRDKLFVSFALP